MGTAIDPHRVLVVDDDDAIRETLAEVLSDEGFLVDSAENGAVAFGYLQTHEPPCVIVLDLMMPVMSGAEFREKQLAEPRFAKIPVIVLSAADRGGAMAQQLRAQAFLSKPPTMDTLIDTITRFC